MMKKMIIACLTAVCLMGCYTSRSKFVQNDVSLGTSKATVEKRYGKPFSRSFEQKGGVLHESLSYVEKVGVDLTSDYLVTTTFYFENDRLTSMKQEKEQEYAGHKSAKSKSE